MREEDYYAPGSFYDPSAPWNQVEPPEREFDVTISQTLSRQTTITTKDYTAEFDEEDGRQYTNTEYTDWRQAYEESSYTPLELIEKFKEYLEVELINEHSTIPKWKCKDLIAACEGWVEDDIEVIEE